MTGKFYYKTQVRNEGQDSRERLVSLDSSTLELYTVQVEINKTFFIHNPERIHDPPNDPCPFGE